MPHSRRSERGALAAARSRASRSHQSSSSISVRRGWSGRRISLRMSSSVRRTGSESGAILPDDRAQAAASVVSAEPAAATSASGP